jgi:hypothetical protein
MMTWILFPFFFVGTLAMMLLVLGTCAHLLHVI